ncbi:alternate-type signal peptide domain-containing protein [Herbiconiux sp. CPCC 205716]|uniref:Alternate-type signal peptide domain-containing protein n=1 Tax=Herbiconiux gentiana TaxID=2970912 RepID=A0ABT2GH11_9MICO|nr:alternate-type signal peptide domain-containing protein [Herbiconiux gentiana]MCS5715513.1 alternate-type signal peptide domain-containing protein [Herbiconiux gentiana]
MNKLTKGAIAAAAGVVLLLGGAGTFAFWNSSAQVAGGTITAGNLAVSNADGPGSWTDQNGAAVNIATYKIVPGDTLTYTDTLSVVAVGDNLVATLGILPGTIAAASSSNPADVALAAYLNAGATNTLTASGTGISGTGPTYTVTAGAAGVSQNVTATVKLKFPNVNTAGAENAAKLGAVNLSNLTLTLTQTAPAVNP